MIYLVISTDRAGRQTQWGTLPGVIMYELPANNEDYNKELT